LLGVLFIGFLEKKDKKSLIISLRYQQTIMIHTKRVIFMILPLLFVPVVYGLSSTPDACAAPQDPSYGTGDCKTEDKYGYTTCCWKDKAGKSYCQACKTDGFTVNCGPVQGPIGLEQPPTPTPFDPTAPLQGGVLEQPEQPPLFGRNEGAVPPTGGIEQPFTSTPFQQIPQGTVQRQDQPFLQSESPPTLSLLPTPPPPIPPPTQTGPTDAPQDDEEGGGLPTIKSQEDVPLGETIEQPEPEQPSSSEDEGQNPTIIE
jgi:hypothetical protein